MVAIWRHSRCIRSGNGAVSQQAITWTNAGLTSKGFQHLFRRLIASSYDLSKPRNLVFKFPSGDITGEAKTTHGFKHGIQLFRAVLSVKCSPPRRPADGWDLMTIQSAPNINMQPGAMSQQATINYNERGPGNKRRYKCWVSHCSQRAGSQKQNQWLRKPLCTELRLKKYKTQ